MYWFISLKFSAASETDEAMAQGYDMHWMSMSSDACMKMKIFYI